mmetsp:Transcript_7185/g.6297  ORF Transcript_7185/g.6297 Transcript_7185/m.6297 type:complete len:207 (-) Transcript_7185:1699-2319(-)
MTTSELMVKIQEFHNFTSDFQAMSKKQESILNRLFRVETQLKNSISSDILNQSMTFVKDELKNYADIKAKSLEISVKSIENNLVPKNIFNDSLSKLVPIATIDKLYKNVQGLKNDIEKSMEIKMNSELSDFKINLGKKINGDDVEKLMNNFVKLSDFDIVKSQIGDIDLVQYTDKFRIMIEQKLREFKFNKGHNKDSDDDDGHSQS